MSSTNQSAIESIDAVYGRLLESVHFAGYGFDRACDQLQHLLTDGRWTRVGPRYEHIDDFLNTLKLGHLRAAAEKRKALSLQLAKLGAGQRATARMLGVDKNTVRADLGKIPPKSKAKSAECNGYEGDSGGDSPPWTLSGFDAAKAVKRTAAKRAKRGRRLAIGNGSPPPPELRTGDFREVLSDIDDDSVSLIFTDPPYDTESIPLYGDLAKFAARVLRPGGSLLAYCSQHAMPKIINLICPHLQWHWLLGCYNGSSQYSRMYGHNVLVAWRPILWFVKPPRRRLEQPVVDMVSRGEKPEKEFDSWQQPIAEPLYFIEALSEPGGLIVDPFAGSGTTILAARKLGRRVIAAEIDEKAVAAMSARLAAEERGEASGRAIPD